MLTYNRAPETLQGMGLTTETALRRMITELGEPIVSTFEPAEIERLLRELGFVEIVHVGPEEAAATGFAGRADVRFGGARRLVIAGVP